ncbi:MAG: transglutaminase domain-containing protein [Candidatus Heimdallarchaeota archaeon]
MQIKAFKSTTTGDIAITKTNPIASGEQLRLMVIPAMNDSAIVKASKVEVLNPYEIRVVNSSLPVFDQTKVVYFDITTPKNWTSGRYLTSVLDINGKIITSCYFYFQAGLNAHVINRQHNPKWLLNYSLNVKNISEKPVGNFSAFIALPLTISPQQIVSNLQIHPSNLKIATDVEGNCWTHFSVKRMEAKESRLLSYSAEVEMKPLIIPQRISKIAKTNPYERKFLQTYLKPEPHIESDHPKIVEMAAKIPNSNPLTFAKRAAKQVQKTVKYEIQPGEFGAAFAIEKRKGDCTEFAALFVALCRAAGIPARTNAGFALAQRWERHATAEFLVQGRWIPIDLTMQRSSEIVLGSLPLNIIVTRGNWMGGTLAKEVAYKYQVIEPNQKIDVDILWNIVLSNGNNYSKTNRLVTNKTVKIINPQIFDSSKIKPKVIEQSKIKIIDESVKHDADLVKIPKTESIVISEKKKKMFEIKVEIPDAIKQGTSFKPQIFLINHSENTLTGCCEIREFVDGIIKIRSFIGKKIPPNSQRTIRPTISLDTIGMSELEFTYSNRIGRVLARITELITLY